MCRTESGEPLITSDMVCIIGRRRSWNWSRLAEKERDWMRLTVAKRMANQTSVAADRERDWKKREWREGFWKSRVSEEDVRGKLLEEGESEEADYGRTRDSAAELRRRGRRSSQASTMRKVEASMTTMSQTFEETEIRTGIGRRGSGGRGSGRAGCQRRISGENC